MDLEEEGKGKGKGKGKGLGLSYVQFSRSFSRKRIAVEIDSTTMTPTKKQCSHKSPLKALPQDILIRILCGVDHDDLKGLVTVSKWIREATLVARKMHFAYNTPTKRRMKFQNCTDLIGSTDFQQVEAPNAPKQWRKPPSRLSKKKLADISVSLFGSTDEDEDEEWPRRELFMDMET